MVAQATSQRRDPLGLDSSLSIAAEARGSADRDDVRLDVDDPLHVIGPNRAGEGEADPRCRQSLAPFTKNLDIDPFKEPATIFDRRV